MRYQEFKLIEDCIDFETAIALKEAEQPKKLPKMRWVRFVSWIGAIYHKLRETVSKDLKTATDMNGITIGEMLLLTSLQGEQLVYAVFSVLYGFTPAQVELLKTEDVYGTMNFARAELERIGKLFSAAKIDPRPEEERAGVNEMGKNSTLSLIDYISKRQGITLDDAAKMKWRTVLELLKIDKEAELYRRRLEAEYKKKK